MPLLRRSDEEERQNLLGGAEMEMRRLRRIDHRAPRRHRRPLRRVPVVASVEGHAARDARRWPDLQAQDRRVLGGLAHAGARRRVPPGPLRRRDLARGTPGRADLLQRGSGGLVVHGAIRELEGVVGAHGADTGARRRGHRRRQRLRQGRARGLAPDQGAECLFHAYAQVKRCTTTRPKLQAGRELYQIALDLTHIKTLHQAELWRERYLDWCGFWSDFLEDTTLVEGKRVYTHERLRKARRSLSSLVSAGTLFTFLDPELTKAGPLPYTITR